MARYGPQRPPPPNLRERQTAYRTAHVQKEAHLTQNNSYRIEANWFLIRTNECITRANELCIEGYATGRLELRWEAQEVRTEALEYLRHAMRSKARCGS